MKAIIKVLVLLLLFTGCLPEPPEPEGVPWFIKDDYTPYNTTFEDNFNVTNWSGTNLESDNKIWERYYQRREGTLMLRENVLNNTGAGTVTLRVQSLLRPPYNGTGGTISTIDNTFLFGLYEARFQCSSQDNIGHLFYLLSRDEEAGFTSQIISMKFITSNFGGSTTITISVTPDYNIPDMYYTRDVTLSFNPSGAEHIYGIDVQPEGVTFFADNVKLHYFDVEYGSPEPRYPSRIFLSSYVYDNGVDDPQPPSSDGDMVINWVRFIPN